MHNIAVLRKRQPLLSVVYIQAEMKILLMKAYLLKRESDGY